MSESGYVVDYVKDGMDGLYLVEESDYDVFVVDWMLLWLDGLIMVEKLWGYGNEILVLFFLVLGEVDDWVMGLCFGGDDYFIKFFVFFEFLVCFEVLLWWRVFG